MLECVYNLGEGQGKDYAAGSWCFSWMWHRIDTSFWLKTMAIHAYDVLLRGHIKVAINSGSYAVPA